MRQNKILESAIFPKADTDSDTSSSSDDYLHESRLKLSEIIVNNHKQL
jgi:hypothetical protein